MLPTKTSAAALYIVCYTAVFSVVTQRLGGGALRDDTKNGCVADYTLHGTIYLVCSSNLCVCG